MHQPMMLKKLKLSGSVKRAKPSRVNIKKKKKKSPFYHKVLECKSRKSRDT